MISTRRRAPSHPPSAVSIARLSVSAPRQSTALKILALVAGNRFFAAAAAAAAPGASSPITSFTVSASFSHSTHRALSRSKKHVSDFFVILRVRNERRRRDGERGGSGGARRARGSNVGSRRRRERARDAEGGGARTCPLSPPSLSTSATRAWFRRCATSLSLVRRRWRARQRNDCRGSQFGKLHRPHSRVVRREIGDRDWTDASRRDESRRHLRCAARRA